MSNNNRYRNNRNKKKKSFIDESYVPPYDSALLSQDIEFLKLSGVVRDKLLSAEVKTVFDVVRREERDFYRIPTFDKRNLGELKNSLNNKRLRLKPTTERPAPTANVAESAGNEGGAERKQNTEDKGARRDDKQRDRRGDAKRDNRRDGKSDRPAQAQQNKKPAKEKRILDPDGISEKRTKAEREKGRPARPQVEHVTDKYIKINKNDKWGFADREGKEVIAPAYDEVFTFKDELCCVETNEMFGFIDRQGNEVIPAVYECAASFSEGYACVSKGGLCGYIDKENNVVIDFQFDAGTAVIDGGCRVKKMGKWGELHIDDPSEIRWIN